MSAPTQPHPFDMASFLRKQPPNCDVREHADALVEMAATLRKQASFLEEQSGKMYTVSCKIEGGHTWRDIPKTNTMGETVLIGRACERCPAGQTYALAKPQTKVSGYVLRAEDIAAWGGCCRMPVDEEVERLQESVKRFGETDTGRAVKNKSKRAV